MHPLMCATGDRLLTPTYTGLGEREHLANPSNGFSRSCLNANRDICRRKSEPSEAPNGASSAGMSWRCGLAGLGRLIRSEELLGKCRW